MQADHEISLFAAHDDSVSLTVYLLQKIYVSLADDDGVAGVAAIRKSTSTLQETILEYESVGMFVCEGMEGQSL